MKSKREIKVAAEREEPRAYGVAFGTRAAVLAGLVVVLLFLATAALGAPIR